MVLYITGRTGIYITERLEASETLSLCVSPYSCHINLTVQLLGYVCLLRPLRYDYYWTTLCCFSDGVGRTGTYSLIDLVLNRMSKGKIQPHKPCSWMSMS